MNQRIYLDNNATTAVDPEIIDEITLAFQTLIGNPSSVHFYGQQAKARLQKARDEIAKTLSKEISSREIIFTSGATEALNLVIRGLDEEHGHVISSDVEHSAVYATLQQLKNPSYVTFLKAGLYGAVTLDAVKQAYRHDTKMIVLMAVNNETGVKTDIAAIAAFAKEKGIHFVVDGVALLGKEPFEIPGGVSAICFSGHKFHAPKGVGFCMIRRHLKLKPYMTGGEQEFGLRGGTENLIGIIGMQAAIRILNQKLEHSSKEMQRLRDKFEISLQTQLPNVSVNGLGIRVVNTTNLCFKGIEGELLLAHLDREGVAVSLGSACASGALEPSRVLLNMGLPVEDAVSSIRFSLSRMTTEDEIDRAIEIIVRVVNRLK